MTKPALRVVGEGEGAEAPFSGLPPVPEVEQVPLDHVYCDKDRIIRLGESDVLVMADALQRDGVVKNAILLLKEIGYRSDDGMVWEPPAWRLKVIDGATRVAAARHLGWTHVPARVYPPGSLDEAKQRYLEARENLTRRHLTELGRFTLLLEEMEAGQKADIYSAREDNLRQGSRTPQSGGSVSWNSVVEQKYHVTPKQCEHWFTVIRKLRSDTARLARGVHVLGLLAKHWSKDMLSNRSLLTQLADYCATGKASTRNGAARLTQAEQIDHFQGVKQVIERVAAGERIETVLEEVRGKAAAKKKPAAFSAGGKGAAKAPSKPPASKAGKEAEAGQASTASPAPASVAPSVPAPSSVPSGADEKDRLEAELDRLFDRYLALVGSSAAYAKIVQLGDRASSAA